MPLVKWRPIWLKIDHPALWHTVCPAQALTSQPVCLKFRSRQELLISDPPFGRMRATFQQLSALEHREFPFRESSASLELRDAPSAQIVPVDIQTAGPLFNGVPVTTRSVAGPFRELPRARSEKWSRHRGSGRPIRHRHPWIRPSTN